MLQGCHILIQVVEMLLGIWMIYELYPEFRREGIWIRGGWIIGCAVLGILYVWNAQDAFISNIFILLFAAMVSTVYGNCFKVKFLHIFILEVLYLTGISFLKLPVLILEGILFDKTLIALNRGSRTILECCWCIILMAAIVLLMRKRGVLENYKKLIYLLLSEQIGLLSIVTGVQWCLLSYNMWLGEQGFQAIDLVLNVLLVFCIFLFLHFMVLRNAYNKMQMDNKNLDMSQELLQKQNAEIHKLYQKDRLRLHEYSRTLEYLYCCMKEKRYQDAENFLHKQIDELDEEKHQVWTGLPFLDFIINYKKQAMDKAGIVFRLELDVYEYPFEEAELGILLGNLLDNAIEACEKCVPGKREIYLHIWNVRYMFLLKLVNSSSKSPKISGQRFITDKADKNAHGMGVEQVRRIVRRYGGDIDFQYNGECFEVKLIAPVKEEEKE